MTHRDLDPSQRAAVDRGVSGVNVRIFGAPGTGKSTVAMAILAELIERHDERVARIVTPSRAAATRIRDEVGLRVGVATRGPLARSISSLAFDIVSAANPAGVPPRLLSGGQQDSDIKELVDGEIVDRTDGYWPASLGPDVRRLREFRTQLRDLLARARDAELVDHTSNRPLARLVALAEDSNRSEWVASALFLEKYLAAVRVARPGQVDPAELLSNATDLIRSTPAETPTTLVVDDAHDLTPSQWRFVEAWATHRGPIVVLGDPQLATTGFRGGVATFLRANDAHIDWADSLTLELFHRQSGAATTLLRMVASAIGGGVPSIVKSYPSALEPSIARDTEGTALMSASAASPAHERDIVARFIRNQIVSGVPLERIAVIVRSGSIAESMVTSLTAASIPAYLETTGSPLRDHPAVWSLLQLVNVGIGRETLSVTIAHDLLTGPFGRLTTLDYRRFRRNLRKAEITSGGNRLADELMIEALTNDGAFETEVRFSAPGVRWIVDTLRALRSSTKNQIDELLWLAWNRSDRARVWADESLGTGVLAAKAHDSLDAVMALFDLAATSLDNAPHEVPDVFLDRMLDQTVPNDSLSPRATSGAVLVCTPAAAVGREFDVVVLAGLNEGVWPNTRVRSALLRAHELTLRAEGIDLSSVDLRKEVLFDELRLFLVAASRATDTILATAIDSEDESPSALFRMIAGEKEIGEDTPRSTPADNALGSVFVSDRIDATIGELVGRLRHVLVADSEWRDGVEYRFSSSDKSRAAAALRELGRRGVAGASPEEWIGYTRQPVHTLFADGRFTVSPSGMESFDDNNVDWFISQVSGSAGGVSSVIGTLVHRALELYPTGVADDMWRVVDDKWREINFEAGWESAQWLRFTRLIVENIAQYIVDSGSNSIAQEKRIRVPVPSNGTSLNITISGSIDRVEETRDGKVIVLDLKTGKSAVSGPEAERHLQLKAYQLALTHDDVLAAIVAGRELDSAALLYPRVRNQSAKTDYTLRTQRVMDSAAVDEFVAKVLELGVLMQAERFTGKRHATQYGTDVNLDTTWARVPEVSSDV